MRYIYRLSVDSVGGLHTVVAWKKVWYTHSCKWMAHTCKTAQHKAAEETRGRMKRWTIYYKIVRVHICECRWELDLTYYLMRSEWYDVLGRRGTPRPLPFHSLLSHHMDASNPSPSPFDSITIPILSSAFYILLPSFLPSSSYCNCSMQGKAIYSANSKKPNNMLPLPLPRLEATAAAAAPSLPALYALHFYSTLCIIWPN